MFHITLKISNNSTGRTRLQTISLSGRDIDHAKAMALDFIGANESAIVLNATKSWPSEY